MSATTIRNKKPPPSGFDRDKKLEIRNLPGGARGDKKALEAFHSCFLNGAPILYYWLLEYGASARARAQSTLVPPHRARVGAGKRAADGLREALGRV